MEEMINRKNEVLLRGSEKFKELAKIARMLEGVEFKNVGSAEALCEIVAAHLRDLSYFSYTMREEADKALPEAVEVPDEASV